MDLWSIIQYMVKMKVFIACVLLLLVQDAVSDEVVDINHVIDKYLVAINKDRTDLDFGLQQLPSQIIDGIVLKNGVQVGLNSLIRTRDCTLTQNSDKSVTLDVHIGLSLYELAFGLIRHKGVDMSGVISVRNISAALNYTLAIIPECRVTLNRYEYEELTAASLRASLPDQSGDISNFFSDRVRPLLNRKIAQAKDQIQSLMQSQVCWNNGHLNESHGLKDVVLALFSNVRYI